MYGHLRGMVGIRTSDFGSNQEQRTPFKRISCVGRCLSFTGTFSITSRVESAPSMTLHGKNKGGAAARLLLVLTSRILCTSLLDAAALSK